MDMKEEDIIHDLRQVAQRLAEIGDGVSRDTRFQVLLGNVAQTSLFGRQYTVLTSLIREFVMLVQGNSNIPVELVQRVIKIFLLMWKNQELSEQISKEMNLGTSADMHTEHDDIPDEQVPPEIQHMSDGFIRQYHKVLSQGTESVKSIRLMVVGMFGVGKTSLVENLLDNRSEANEKDVKPETVKSTVGIDVRYCTIREDGKWVKTRFEEDRRKKLQEVVASQMSREHCASDDMIDAGRSEGTEEEPDNRKEPLEDELKLTEESSMEETNTTSEELSAFKEKLLSKNDDHQFVDFVRNVLDAPEVGPSSPTVSVWDFAGQYIYYSTHHFFLNSRSIYLLLMDISRPLDSIVKEKVCFPMPGFLHKDFTCLEAFKFWLNSIHMYSSQQNLTEDHKPTVILVGTHKDKLTGSDEDKEKQKDNFFDEALKSFLKSPVLKIVHPKKFLINNLDRNMDSLSIRKEVLDLAGKQKYWGEARPTKWIPLERKFLEMKANGKEIITFEEIREVDQMSEFHIECEKELRSFLQFQHLLGNILYYETDLLQNYVILSPQWIIGAFRCFITHVPDKNPMELDLWDDFEKKAILKRKLIDEIMDNNPKNEHFKKYKREIIQYMEYLDMIAKPVRKQINDSDKNTNTEVKSYSEDVEPLNPLLKNDSVIGTATDKQKADDVDVVVSPDSLSQSIGNRSASVTPSDFYIVPSLLKSRPSKKEFSDLINPDSAEKTPILCLKFRNGFMPPSVFHRLLAICIKHYVIVSENGENRLYNGLGVFFYAHTSTFSIWFNDNIIYAQVYFYPQKQPLVAQKIRQFLVQNLTEILRILPNESRINEIMPFEECIQCPEMSCFEPGIGLLRMKDFLYKNGLMCEDCPRLHFVSKDKGIGLWCYDSVQKQKSPSIPDTVLNRKPSAKELGHIAMCIGKEYFQLGLELKLSPAEIEQIRDLDRFHLPTRIYKMLYNCFNCKNQELNIGTLRNAMIAVESDICTFDSVFAESFGQDKLLRDLGIRFDRKPTDAELVSLAAGIGDLYWLLGVELGVPEIRMQQIRADNQTIATRALCILQEWCKKDVNIEQLGKAMLLVGADIESFYRALKSVG